MGLGTKKIENHMSLEDAKKYKSEYAHWPDPIKLGYKFDDGFAVTIPKDAQCPVCGKKYLEAWLCPTGYLDSSKNVLEIFCTSREKGETCAGFWVILSHGNPDTIKYILHEYKIWNDCIKPELLSKLNQLKQDLKKVVDKIQEIPSSKRIALVKYKNGPYKTPLPTTYDYAYDKDGVPLKQQFLSPNETYYMYFNTTVYQELKTKRSKLQKLVNVGERKLNFKMNWRSKSYNRNILKKCKKII